MRILLIDDDATLGAAIRDQIAGHGHAVNTIEAHVSRLLKKLSRDVIVTARGLGYRLGSA